MKKRSHRIMFSMFCLLFSLMLGVLEYLKEDTRYDLPLPDSPPTTQWAMEDGNFTWEQAGDTYYLQLENTGTEKTEVHVKYGFPWPGYILITYPGEIWELAAENALPFTHTITFEAEEGTPSGTVKVWTGE